MGYRLSKKERLLVDYLLFPLQSTGLKTLNEPFFADLSEGICYYPELSDSSLEIVTEWMCPVIIFAGKKIREESHYHLGKLYNYGLPAVWKLPENDEPVIFPALNLPDTRHHAYFISENAHYRKLFRQILRFGAYNTRVDFQSNEGLETELKRLAESKDSAWPSLIIVDLDSVKIDVQSFFYLLRNLFQKNPVMKGKTSILVMKDFAKPGLDVRTIASSLKPLTKRIFHPHEAILALSEGMCASKKADKTVDIRIKPFRSIEDFLYGKVTEFRYEDPAKLLAGTVKINSNFNRFVMFSWLSEYLSSDKISSGVVLNPEPVIDPGNFFNGIRSP